MITLVCYNLSTGQADIIHKWPDETSRPIIEKFINWEVAQDLSAEHVYYERVYDD